MSKGKLTHEDIQHLAKLSNLTVDHSEIESLSNQLEETISYVENLNELNTDNIADIRKSDQEVNRGFIDGEKNSRQLSQDQAVKGSKNANGKYFVVKRIM